MPVYLIKKRGGIMNTGLTVAQSLTAAQRKIIGKGMAFPNSVNKARGTTNTAEGFDKINQSIAMILNTPVGSRIGNRAFGSKLHTLIFEPNDYILADLLKLYIHESIVAWEPRITVQDIDVDRDYNDETIMRCTIHYVIKNSNLANNYVYPFVRPNVIK